MAKNTRNSRASGSGRNRRSGRTAKRSSSIVSRSRRRKYEFKPDEKGASWLKRLYLTRLQRLTLLKWGLYALVCVLLLVIQDVIMSRLSFYGATTDLVPAAILLITVLVGSEYGSIFVLTASTLYWCAGSSPGAYCIALMCFFGIFATLFRQVYWRRGFSSTVLCAGVALMLYELSVFLAGMLMGLTLWDRVFRFLLTGAMSWLIMLPLYPLAYKIGQIGGEPWKE